MKNILLLHGAIGSKDQFKPLITLLKPNYKIHTMNFSGHGGKPFENHFDIPQFAKEVDRYMEENNIQAIDILGYSMGGYVALYLAKNYPNRVKKIITLGTKFLWNPEIASNEVKMLNPDKIEGKIPAFAQALEKRHSPNNWKDVLNKTASMMTLMGEKNPLNLTDYNTIHHSVKIGLADKDEMVTTEETMDVVKAIPNAQFYTLNNSNHPIEKVDNQQLYHEIELFIN